MAALERWPLNGPVKVDQSFIGGPEGVRGRFFRDRELVVVAVEVRGAGSGRLRMQVIETPRLRPSGVRTTNVSAGSIVRIHGWTA